MSDCRFVKIWLACLPSHWHDDFRASFKEAIEAENATLLEYKSRVMSEIRNTDDARAKLFASEERAKRLAARVAELEAELERKDDTLRDFAERGTRHDLHPTCRFTKQGAEPIGGWGSYIASMDESVRTRAKAALSAEDDALAEGGEG